MEDRQREEPSGSNMVIDPDPLLAHREIAELVVKEIDLIIAAHKNAEFIPDEEQASTYAGGITQWKLFIDELRHYPLA